MLFPDAENPGLVELGELTTVDPAMAVAIEWCSLPCQFITLLNKELLSR